MARTPSQIYNAISSDVTNHPELSNLQPQIDDAQTLLSDLNSPSGVANWRLYKWAFSVAAWVIEQLFDSHKEEVAAMVETSRAGSLPWWQQTCIDFQLGYSLTWNGFRYVYATIDENAKIIKRAAATESGRNVLLKVAKLTAGEVVKLGSDELIAFQAYVAKKKIPGSQVLCISNDADLLKLSYTIYYDPLLLNSSGELLTDTSIKPVEVAINDYISAIEWNGSFNVQEAIAQINAATGVNDIVPGIQYIKPSGGVYRSIARNVISASGYMKIDPAFPLSSQLTYIANV